MIWSKTEGRNRCYIGILKRFQWIGFMISTDNSVYDRDYFLFELRFLWLRIWFIRYFKK